MIEQCGGFVYYLSFQVWVRDNSLGPMEIFEMLIGEFKLLSSRNSLCYLSVVEVCLDPRSEFEIRDQHTFACGPRLPRRRVCHFFMLVPPSTPIGYEYLDFILYRNGA